MSQTQYDRLIAAVEQQRADFKSFNDQVLPAILAVIKEETSKHVCLKEKVVIDFEKRLLVLEEIHGIKSKKQVK